MKPIFTCFSVCQGVQELRLLGRKENSQGMKFSTQSSRPAMVRIFTPFALQVCQGIEPLYLFLCRLGRFQQLKSGLRFASLPCAINTHFSGCLDFGGGMILAPLPK